MQAVKPPMEAIGLTAEALDGKKVRLRAQGLGGPGGEIAHQPASKIFLGARKRGGFGSSIVSKASSVYYSPSSLRRQFHTGGRV